MSPRGEKILAGAAVLAAGAAFSATVFPEGTKEIATTPIEAIQKANEPNETSTTIEQAPSCIDISRVDSSAKIGSLILVMAEPTEFDALQLTMQAYKISNFALTTQNPLTDQVGFHGEIRPVAEATNTLIQEVGDAIGVKKITFALDEEGGAVQRTKNLTGFQKIPAASEQDPAQITSTFESHSQMLKTLGVTLVFGPVTDVDQGGFIGKRSYGSSVEEVVADAGAALTGMHNAGIDGTLKHFPGHGSVQIDSHDNPSPTVDYASLQQTELPAFAQLIAAQHPDAVMVAHAPTPGLTDNLPASLSPNTYNLLKNELGFQGVAITDALNMGAVLIPLGYEKGSVEGQAAAAVQAVTAGADQVIINLAAAEAVASALQNIPADRLNNAATRVFEQKGYDIC